MKGLDRQSSQIYRQREDRKRPVEFQRRLQPDQFGRRAVDIDRCSDRHRTTIVLYAEADAITSNSQIIVDRAELVGFDQLQNLAECQPPANLSCIIDGSTAGGSVL